MNVLILGCGPAGLMAAHAAFIEGHNPVIVSKARKSYLFGAQYLHQPIPGATDNAPIQVDYRLQGTSDEYRVKVYGPNSRVDVSPDTLIGKHDAWDIRSTYDHLWHFYERYIMNQEVTGKTLGMAMESWMPDLTISTIPRPALCIDPSHSFGAETVWAIGDAPEFGKTCPVKVRPNTVICNGEDAPAWYRAANVFGHTTAEWPERKKPPFGTPAAVLKPTTTNCTCYPDVVHLGRYGAWQKGVLSHEAFFRTQEILTSGEAINAVSAPTQ